KNIKLQVPMPSHWFLSMVFIVLNCLLNSGITPSALSQQNPNMLHTGLENLPKPMSRLLHSTPHSITEVCSYISKQDKRLNKLFTCCTSTIQDKKQWLHIPAIWLFPKKIPKFS